MWGFFKRRFNSQRAKTENVRRQNLYTNDRDVLGNPAMAGSANYDPPNDVVTIAMNALMAGYILQEPETGPAPVLEEESTRHDTWVADPSPSPLWDSSPSDTGGSYGSD